MALIQMETLEEAIEALVVSYHVDINWFNKCGSSCVHLETIGHHVTGVKSVGKLLCMWLLRSVMSFKKVKFFKPNYFDHFCIAF